MVDRFNNPNAAPKLSWDGSHGIFQGGTFNGIRDRLGYLQDLGVGAIWLSPVLKNCQFDANTHHGYGIQNFLEIEPRFASTPAKAEDELRALIDAVHARGMYVIFDIVLNHTGDVFAYKDFGSQAPPAQNGPYTIFWRDESGQGNPEWTDAPVNPPLDAAVWPTELCRNELFRRKGEGSEAGGDFASLKELVTEFQKSDTTRGPYYTVRDILIRAHQYLIAKFDIDGFRIDTLKYVERDFARIFGNAIREYALSIGKKNFFTFGEVWDNEEKVSAYVGRYATEESDLVGVDAALDFPLFETLSSVAKGLLEPDKVVDMFEKRKRLQRNVVSSHGEASRFFVTFLDNHDLNEQSLR